MNEFVFTKEPGDRLDYDIDYKNVIIGNDRVLSSTWDVPTGLDDGDSFGAKATKIWLKDGITGNNYTITNTMTTVQGRVFVRSFILRIV